MRYVHLSMLVLLFLGGLQVDIYAQAPEQESAIAKKNADSQELQLTTTIDSYQYCAGDNDLDAFRMILKMRFKNNGNETLVLYKGSNSIYHYLVNGNNQNVLDVTQTIFFNSERVVFNEDSYKELFVALPKNAIYETSTQVTIPVTKNDDKMISGAIGNGSYTLQVEVSTWLESYELARELRDKWKERGILWYEPIRSLPMSFEVIRNRKVINCN